MTAHDGCGTWCPLLARLQGGSWNSGEDSEALRRGRLLLTCAKSALRQGDELAVGTLGFTRAAVDRGRQRQQC